MLESGSRPQGTEGGNTKKAPHPPEMFPRLAVAPTCGSRQRRPHPLPPTHLPRVIAWAHGSHQNFACSRTWCLGGGEGGGGWANGGRRRGGEGGEVYQAPRPSPEDTQARSADAAALLDPDRCHAGTATTYLKRWAWGRGAREGDGWEKPCRREEVGHVGRGCSIIKALETSWNHKATN
jgi:hypothetical protein